MKTAIKITALLLFLFTSVGFTSCSDDDDNNNGNANAAFYIGTWCYADEGYYEEITFRSNGTGTWTSWYDNEEYNESESFTYTYSDGVIIMTAGDETESFSVESVSQNQIKIDGDIYTRKQA